MGKGGAPAKSNATGHSDTRGQFGGHRRAPGRRPFRCSPGGDARGGIRTHDLRLRRPTLYPAELRALDSATIHSVAPATYNRSTTPPIAADDEAPGVQRANAGGFRQSGRLDLNQRPPAPEAGALPGYATPRRDELGQRNAPGETRTPNLLIRSQMLYPIELRALGQVRQLAEASWRLAERTRVAFAHSA